MRACVQLRLLCYSSTITHSIVRGSFVKRFNAIFNALYKYKGIANVSIYVRVAILTNSLYFNKKTCVNLIKFSLIYYQKIY